MSLTYLLVRVCKLANEAVFCAGFPADTQPDSIAFWFFLSVYLAS